MTIPHDFGSPEARDVVRKAIAGGWVWAGCDSRSHGVIEWPPTGTRLTVSSSPSVASWKSLATDITRASGVQVWSKGNRRRSRKKIVTSGFSVERSSEEQAAFAAICGPEIERLTTRRDGLIRRCQGIARDRGKLRGIPPLLKQIESVEAELRDRYHQHVEPFDPYSLNMERRS